MISYSKTHTLFAKIFPSFEKAKRIELRCSWLNLPSDSLASGLEKCKFRRATFCSGGVHRDSEDPESAAQQPRRSAGNKKRFMDSIAKSISFPSPKRVFRAPSMKQASNNKYEITVEHQELKDPAAGDTTPQIRWGHLLSSLRNCTILIFFIERDENVLTHGEIGPLLR